MKQLILLFLISLLLVSCSSNKEIEITLSSIGETMKYDQEILEIKTGSKVTLTFINKATMQGMNHNVVILKQKTNVKKFASQALSHGPSYIPPSDKIIAKTKMTKPGETVTITFTMPNKKGYYPFVCTFPGHASSMQGTIRAI